MGQYHYVANYDKREFIDPHKFNDGLKLMEFGCSSQSTLTGLAILLAASCQGGARGGGDIHPWIGDLGYEDRVIKGLTEERGEYLMKEIVGRWAGDRIAIIGDYSVATDAGGLVGREGSPWDNDPPRDGGQPWKDISADTLAAIEMDYYVYTERHKEAADA